ncbi:MAG: M20/M25/M40 family metallo-hydrolase [Aquamicrobium sp.]|nr:M20/M25/M40 family metallo-hydrolase [Aquamicrobium sp.]
MTDKVAATNRILTGIKRWAAMESPSNRPELVERLAAHVAEHLESIGAACERVNLGSGCARPVIARFNRRDAPGPQGILILGHLDTVHPAGSTDGSMPIRIEGNRLFGPGVMDMKGGVYLAVDALERLFRSEQLPGCPITVLLNTDEEIGSPFSRELIEREALRHEYVLVPEPVRQGHAVTGRYAFARYEIMTRGTPAHAGADNKTGRSAIRAMAGIVERLEALTDMDRLVSFSVGVIHGGEFVNVVPTECTAQVLAVADSADNLRYIQEVMDSIPQWATDVAIEVKAGPKRPLFLPTERSMQLFEKAREIASGIGIDLKGRIAGGGSDGNFTGALGVPTLDGIGVAGAGPHTLGESLEIDTLANRAELIRTLILELSVQPQS